MNAVRGPALRVPGSGGLIPAEAAASPKSPDSVPGGGWAVIQNDGAASSVFEGALTISLGEAGER